MLFGIGRAQAATFERHRMGEALVSLTRAFDYYAQAEDADRAVTVAQHPLLLFAGRGLGVAELLERALPLVPPDSTQAGQLLARHGEALGMERGDYDAARDAFSHALDIARRVGDLDLELRTLSNAAYVDYFHLHYPESLEKSLKAIELAHHVDEPGTKESVYSTAALNMSRTGQLEPARQYAAETLVAAETLRDRERVVRALWLNAALGLQAGDSRVARNFIDRGLELSPRASTLHFERLLLEYEVGDFRQGEAHLQNLMEVLGLHPLEPSNDKAFCALAIAMVSRITGMEGHLEIAERVAEAIVSSPSATRRTVMIARGVLALLAILQGHDVRAGEQYTALQSVHGTVLTGTLSVDRLLGLLSVTMGRLDRAVDHFEDGLEFCRGTGRRLELAWTCCDYADTLLQRNGPGDREKAMSLLDESLAVSTELGMRPLMERVLSRREI